MFTDQQNAQQNVAREKDLLFEYCTYLLGFYTQAGAFKRGDRSGRFKRRFLGGCTFRGGKRSLAFPVKHKMPPAQQNSFRKFLVNRSFFHTEHRFCYICHCNLLGYKLPKNRLLNGCLQGNCGTRCVRCIPCGNGRRVVYTAWSKRALALPALEQ